MSSYYFPAPHASTNSHSSSSSSHNHHGGRSRRAPRLSSSQNSHKPFRGVRSMKELTEAEAASVTAFRARFEAGRSFDLDDDLEFCPGLLTEDDLQSIHSSSSDRSSLSSGSPDSSPLQHQIQPAQQVSPTFSLSTHSNPYVQPSFFQPSQMKMQHAVSGRTRNAIPIVNPSTGMRVPSPPQSISPSRMQHNVGRRW